MRYRAVFVLSVLILAFQNCAKSASTSDSSTSSSSSEGAPIGTVCPLAPSALRDPRRIDDLTALINALPKPLTLECFLQNLTAPLSVAAFDSVASVQPSAGKMSPRIFIFTAPLVLAVVPAGTARDLLEVSEAYAPGGTVKAEYTFPVTANLPAAAPYDEIRSSGTLSGTSCRVCHANESQASGFGGVAFTSAMMRPTPGKEILVSTLRAFTSACDDVADPYRCGILRAVFTKGAATQGSFP